MDPPVPNDEHEPVSPPEPPCRISNIRPREPLGGHLWPTLESYTCTNHLATPCGQRISRIFRAAPTRTTGGWSITWDQRSEDEVALCQPGPAGRGAGRAASGVPGGTSTGPRPYRSGRTATADRYQSSQLPHRPPGRSSMLQRGQTSGGATGLPPGPPPPPGPWAGCVTPHCPVPRWLCQR